MGLRAPSELIWGQGLFRYSQGQGEGHSHYATPVRESWGWTESCREVEPSSDVDLNGRGISLPQRCVGICQVRQTIESCLWLAGGLRERLREGQIKSIHMKEKVTGGTFELSQMVSNQLTKDSHVDP